MKLSHRGLYALRALLHLADRAERERGGLAKIHDIAVVEAIPEKFLEGILVTLKNARLVASERGRDGGYRLRRPAQEIVIGDVVRLVDGPLAPLGDVIELTERAATEPRHAAIFELLLDVRNAAAAILDHTTLADLLARDLKVEARRRRARARTKENAT